MKFSFLSRCPTRKGPHLALRGESPGFSQVATAKLWSLSSYDGDLSDPLMWGSGKSSLHARGEGSLGIPLQSLPGLRSSSGVEARTSGFISHANMNLRVPLGCPQGSQALSCKETCTSTFLSSWKSSQASCRVDIGISVFLSRCHKAVITAIVF